MTRLDELIDTRRYPVMDPAAPAYRRVVAEGRAAIDDSALCLCPGFLSAAGLARILAEVAAGEGSAEARDFHRVPYVFAPPTDDLPADHPRRRKQHCRIDVLFGRLFGADSPLRRIYESPEVTGFLGAMIGRPVYQARDPEYSLLVTRIPPGGEHGWHFDSNEFVASIMLREAEVGGAFEYVPNLRSEADENYDAVGRVLDGERGPVVPVPVAAGTLILFRGHRSLHRVSPVAGDGARLIALLSYDFDPDMRHDATRLRGEPASGQRAP